MMGFRCMLVLCALTVSTLVHCDRSFVADYENDCFLKDGQPFRYISGTMHYFRVPNQLWADRIQKMKMAGLNTLQTYVEWSRHEPEPGVYNFEGDYDLVNFIQTAQSLGMLVILRTGPYIDAERDMGGLPYWFLRIDPNMKIRTYDETYLKYVQRWFSVLLPMIRPLLYKNGGPIIMAQIENEYGSFACDAHYTSHLRNMLSSYLGDEVQYFTTDGAASSMVNCGKVDKVLATIDFGAGTNVTDVFDMLRWHQSSGPLVNSEFYAGWIDHWGDPHSSVSADAVTKTLEEILSANASVNVYVFHGGTSFGFSAGANLGNVYQPCPTSYDFDAPLSEAGDPTPKYYAIRTTIGKFVPLPPGPVPQPAPKLSLGPVQMKAVSSVFDFAFSAPFVSSEYPMSFEDLKQPYGFVLYQTTVQVIPTDPVLLTVPNIADRGYVYVNKKFQGILSRGHKISSLAIKVQQGDSLIILVENQGRVCYGSGINDRKGIINNVTLGSHLLKHWVMVPLQMDGENIAAVQNMISLEKSPDHVPSYYSGTFNISDKALDTFLKLDGWHKGVAFINGYNIGRYWPITGPQVTLYVPGVWLNKLPSTNTITLLELEHSPCRNPSTCTVQFVAEPIVNGTTPSSYQGPPMFYGQKHLRLDPAESSRHV